MDSNARLRQILVVVVVVVVVFSYPSVAVFADGILKGLRDPGM